MNKRQKLEQIAEQLEAVAGFSVTPQNWKELVRKSARRILELAGEV